MPRRITSIDNPFVKELVRLSGSSRERRKAAMCVLDGPHLVAAFAAAGGTAEALVASESGLARTDVNALFDRVAARDRVIMSDRVFAHAATVTTPVGILACVRVPSHALPARIGDCVILDAIQDNGNVGSILRSAAAAGVPRAIATRTSAFLWSPRVLRAAMGAHFSMQLHEGVGEEILAHADAQVVAASGAGECELYEVDLRPPTAWIFGNEGAGVGARLLERARYRVRIPMPGGTESLNVAAAAAVCLFEQVRQRRSRQ